jgi:hypothetical protein
MAKDRKETLQSDLSAEAEALRQKALGGRAREADRTTLNVGDPKDQGGDAAPPDQLGETLVEKGLISRHQLFNALNESYHRECSLRQALIELGYIDEKTLASEGL